MNHTWYLDDALKLSTEDWKDLLSDENVFDKEDKEMVLFVYNQNDHQSTATEISIAMDGAHANKFSSQNKAIAKRIHKHLNKEAPRNSRGSARYWNVIFDGNIDKPFDEKNTGFGCCAQILSEQ